MDGDVHFIADSAFKKPCVEVMGSASMRGNILFENCHNEDCFARKVEEVEDLALRFLKMQGIPISTY